MEQHGTNFLVSHEEEEREITVLSGPTTHVIGQNKREIKC